MVVFYAARGGWAAVKALRRSGEYQKGDERILGDAAFVDEVLSQAEEHRERKKKDLVFRPKDMMWTRLLSGLEKSWR